MSRRIEETLEVIDEVRKRFQNQTGHGSISRMRVEAVSSVATRRGIATQTVLDKFIRQLQPDVAEAAHFDDLLDDWLVSDSEELENLLRRHASDERDAELITKTFRGPPEPDLLLAQEFGYDPSELSFREGTVQLRLHLRRERNRSLVVRAKQKWTREQDGQLRCSVCSFSFPETYGEVGGGFVEAHHTSPISSLVSDATVSATDLVPVCSNCHSMLHRHRPWLTVEQLRSIVSERSE